MSEVVNIPQLRFPEFNGEWEEKALGVVATITTGSTPSTSNNEYYDGDVAFVSPADIQGNRIVRSTKTTITELGLSVVREIKKRSTLFVCIGSTIGKVSQAGVNCATNQQINALTAKNSFDNDFIYSLLEFKAPRIKLLAGVQAVPQINKSEFSRFKFTFPLLPEQQKIAAFLTAVDNKIEQLSKKQELLGEYKKGLMQQIFSQAIRFQADDGSTFPDWEEQKVGSFMVERNKKSPKSEAFPLMSFVARKGVTEKGKRYNREFLVNDEGGKKYKQTEYGDFIYSSNNLETGSIGLNKYGAATISPVYSIFQITDTCNYEFVSSFLVTKSFIHKMVRFRQGVVYGQWRIHESDFLKIQVELPSLEEQTKIASFLSSIDSKIEQLSKKQALLGEYKKGLMQQIFSQAIRFKADDGSDFPNWEEKKLGDILDYEQPTNYIVDSTEYDNSFDMPVLTAGKSFVLGYTNETHKVFENIPVIIFDDFTTANKYVDFPFKVKSSAMKILKPKDSFVNIRLIFEFIQMLNFPIGEHKRYWISEYQDLKIPFPSFEEQTKIASFLSSIDNKIEQVGKQLDESKQFKKALLQQMFV